MTEDPLQAARDARIAELEAAMRRRSPIGVRAPTAAVIFLATIGLLYSMRGEVAYFLSSREPITLGTEGAYRFEQLQSNRYAQIHGVPTLRGTYSTERGQTFVIVGLRDTPVLVRRGALPGERWEPPKPPPQPDQRPFAIRGRLLSADDAERFTDVFARHRELGEVDPRWIVIEGERPGRDLGSALLASFLVLFALVNLWFFVRDLQFSLGRRT